MRQLHVVDGVCLHGLWLSMKDVRMSDNTVRAGMLDTEVLYTYRAFGMDVKFQCRRY